AVEAVRVGGGVDVDEVEEGAGGDVGGDVGPVRKVGGGLDVVALVGSRGEKKLHAAIGEEIDGTDEDGAADQCGRRGSRAVVFRENGIRGSDRAGASVF